MKKCLTLMALIAFVTGVQAQKKALTETGEEVILYEDGTWKYINKEDDPDARIPVNSKSFKKESSSTFQLKSSKVDMAFWIDPKKWSISKTSNNEDSEYEFQLKEGDLYAMIIPEGLEIPLENLKNIALENGRKVAPDMEIVKQEYRTVNGLKVLLLQMNGTAEGIKFTFYGYYYTDEGCTVQFVTYTSQSLFEKYKSTCEDLLNGMVKK